MMNLRSVVVLCACVLTASSLLSACSSGAKWAKLEVAGPTPSISAKMVCAAEAKRDVAAATGVDTVRPLRPRWSDHLYACDYEYPGARQMTLSVKELSSAKETKNYFDAIGAKLGRVRDLVKLGQGAYATRNGSVVVEKDYRVLLVDVAHLPERFGRPISARSEFALLVANVIIGCWTGA